MSELDKTMPAALEALLRPRRLSRVRRTVARSRADGAWFDALLWTVFATVAVGLVLWIAYAVPETALTARGVQREWLVAGTIFVALAVAGTLWWRWFKWHVHAVVPGDGAPDSKT